MATTTGQVVESKMDEAEQEELEANQMQQVAGSAEDKAELFGNEAFDQGKYFWDRKLHEEFMRHFSCFGKTWKVIS